jgi:hypothetical protein
VPVLQELLILILRLVVVNVVVPPRMAQPHRRYVSQSTLVALIAAAEACEVVNRQRSTEIKSREGVGNV